MAEGGTAFSLDWRSVLARAALAVLAAISALFIPSGALYAFTLVLATYAMADGFAAWASSASFRPRLWAHIARAGIGIATAIAFVTAPRLVGEGSAFPTLAIASTWAAASGLTELIVAVKLGVGKNDWMIVAVGLLLISLALTMPILIFFNPANTIAASAWILALFLVLISALQAFQAKQLRAEVHQ